MEGAGEEDMGGAGEGQGRGGEEECRERPQRPRSGSEEQTYINAVVYITLNTLDTHSAHMQM